MTATKINDVLSSGTNADRLAYTPSLATPASGQDPTAVFLETDTGDTYAWDFGGAAWVQVNSGGGGGTTTNPLTMNNGGAGAASGSTFDGSAAKTISYNTIGASPVPGLPKGRLTLVTLTPVLTSDQTAKTSVFYTPYNGKHVPIYDGAAWADKAFAELTMSLDTSNQLSANLYDLFIFNDSGTIKIGAGPAWSSGTARGTGAGTTELELKDGIWTNKVSITLTNGAGGGTAGVAANTATYVGTIYCTANGQTGMAFKPAAAAGGTANVLGVYNAYNRVRTTAISRDSTATYSYNSTTWRAANNNANNSITYVDGLANLFTAAQYQTFSTGTSNSTNIGINLDSTSAAPGATAQGFGYVAVRESFAPSLGKHTLTAMEATAANQTFFGAVTTPTRQNQALIVELEM